MSKVETMRGPLDAGQLGRVLVHEHIFLTDPEYIVNYRPDFDEDAVVDAAVAELDALKALGVDTIVDLTVLGLGRDIPRIARVAARTALNIIVATGVYTFDHVPEAFAYWGPGLLHHVDDEPMVGLFVRDIVEGIAGTDVCNTVIPALLEGGVSQADIDRMFIDNPRRHFEGAAERHAARN